MRRVRARRFVFATGAYDLVPTFGGNDTPGIFGYRALRLLIERDGIVPGKRAVVYGAGDDLGAAADLLRHHGVETAAVLDANASSALESVDGGDWVTSVKTSDQQRINCDIVCTAFPGQGAYELGPTRPVSNSR